MEPNDINSIQPEINPNLNIAKVKKKIPLNLIIGIIIGVILTASVAFAFFYPSNPAKNMKWYDPDLTPSVYPTDIPVTPTPEASPYQINWLDKPLLINQLAIFDLTKTENNEFGYNFKNAKFYQVATLGDGSQLINLFLPVEDMVGLSGTSYSNLYRLIKLKNGQVSIVNSDGISSFQKYLLPSVTISNISFKELNPPDSINFDLNGSNIYFKKGYTNNLTFDTLSNAEFVKSTEFGDIYVIYKKRDDILSGIYGKDFYLRLKDWTLYTYTQRPSFISDDQKTWITWSDGKMSEDQFMNTVATNKCGLSGGASSLIKNGSSLLDSKVLVATQGNINLYQIKDINNPLLKKLYDLYKINGQYDTSTSFLSSIESYSEVKNHFLYQDSFGDWLIYSNLKYTLQAECGKPVIYLYPPKETQVKVQVGAQISKSEPTYPKGGWTVIAKANGELIYQNQNYPYLFWEGLGNGIYPDYKNRGTLVSQKDLISTVYKQLSQLGLNQKESADFMEFWQSRLPKTPYVRLTWLNTADMDILAPLAVYPRPDTKIRVFLEFEGLEKPISLIPQKLSAPERNGFTLVEWGGLLLK